MCLKPLLNSGGVLNGHLWANADDCPLLTLHEPGLSGWSCISGWSHQGVGVSGTWLGQPLSLRMALLFFVGGRGTGKLHSWELSSEPGMGPMSSQV